MTERALPLTQRVMAMVSSVDGRNWRDGGILDFGREHVFLDTLGNCEVVLPQGLVTFIAEQGVKEYLKGSEQHVGADTGAGRDADSRHGQAGAEEGAAAGDADG